MKVGLMMPFNHVTVGPGAFAQKAEELGFESLGVPEHAVIPARDRRFMAREGVADAYELMGDLFVALGMAASVTKRIKLATGICVLTDRNPLLTAKEAATLDLFSDGRLLLGVGVGSLHDATAIMGIDTRRPWARMADYVGAMRRLWTSDISSYKGEFVSFEDVLSYPKPRQPNGPPVLIGSVSATESLMRKVARWADGWCPCSDAPHNPGGVSPELLRQRLVDLRRHCEELGREYDTMDITICDISLMAALPATRQDARDRMERFAQAGAGRFVAVIPLMGESNFAAGLARLAELYLD